MKASFYRSIIITIVLSLTSASCGLFDREFDYGKVENSLYRNKFFGMSLHVPANCKVSQEQWMDFAKRTENLPIDSLGAINTDSLLNANQGPPKNTKVSKVDMAELISLSGMEEGSFPSYWSFSASAQKIQSKPKVETGKDALLAMGWFLREDSLNNLDAPIVTKMVGGKIFYVMLVKNKADKYHTRYKYYYSAVMNGFVFQIGTMSDKENDGRLSEIIKSIDFKDKD